MKKLKLIGLMLLICSAVFGQQVKVELIVEEDEVEVNGQVFFTVKSNVDGYIIENWPSDFINSNRNQSSSQYVQDYNTGKMQQQHTRTYMGTFTAVGTYKVGPFQMKYNQKTYSSNSVTVKVVKKNPQAAQSKVGNQDAFGLVEASKTQIYEGEALTLRAVVYSKKMTSNAPILQRSYVVKGIVQTHELIDNMLFQSWEKKSYGSKDYFSFSFDKKLMFPSSVGQLAIDPFEVHLLNSHSSIQIISNLPTIEVLPLPSPIPTTFFGGVGQFSVEQKVESKKLQSGDVFTVELKVSGEGNLHNLEIPKLNLPKGMRLYGDVEVKDAFNFGEKGAKGEVVFVYYVQCLKGGNYTLNPIEFTFFNVVAKQFETVCDQNGTNFFVEKNAEFEAKEDAKEDEVVVDQTSKKSSNTNFWWYFLIGGVVIAGGVLVDFILKKRRKKASADVQTVVVMQKPAKEQKKASVETFNMLVKQAESYYESDDSNQFFTMIELAVMVHIKMKLELDEDTSLSRTQMLDMLPAIKSPERILHIREILGKCDAARYGMATDRELRAKVLEDLKSLRK